MLIPLTTQITILFFRLQCEEKIGGFSLIQYGLHSTVRQDDKVDAKNYRRTQLQTDRRDLQKWSVFHHLGIVLL